MSSCENMTVPHQCTRTPSGQFDRHWEWIFKQEVLASNAKTPIVAKDLSLSSDMWLLRLPRKPWRVGRAGVWSGAVAIDPNGGLSKLTVRVECLISQKLPKVPVTRPWGSFVAFWVTGGADIQAGWRQEVRGWSSLRLPWEDHRDTLENPLGAGGGCEHRGKEKEK